MRLLRNRRTLLLSLLAAALAIQFPLGAAAPSGEPVAGQPEKAAPKDDKKKLDEDDGADSFDVYLDEDEDADRLLRLAARYADRKKWRPCLEKYLECMREYGGKITRAGGSDRELYESVNAVVLREMARTPQEGKDLWKLLMGGRYAGRLRSILRAGADPERLSKLVRDFAGLEFSARALLLLGEARYARGDAAGAVDAWRRLLREYPGGDYPRIRLLGRAGLVAAEAGQVSQAEAILAILRRESALAQVKAAGRDMRLVEAIEKRLEVRSSRGAVASLGTAGRTWSLLGGDATHAMPSPPITRPTMLRWRKELPVPPGWRSTSRYAYHPRYSAKTDKSKLWPFPVYHPASSGELLYLAGELGIMAFRAHDGEVVWHAPKGQKGVATSCGLSGAVVAGGRLLAREGRVGMGTRYRGHQPGRSALQLVDALTGKDLRKEGALEAPLEVPRDEDDEDDEDQSGDEKGAEDGNNGADAVQGQRAQPVEQRTTYVGIPVLAGRAALCGAIRRSAQPEYELVAVELGSGKVLWRTFLCGSRPVTSPSPSSWGGASGALLSELGQPPLLSGRTACIVTNLGAVAAVHIETGNLRWLRLYPRYFSEELKAPARRRFVHRRAVSTPDRGKVRMWEPCAPVLAGELLLCAPQDCDFLLAINPQSGRLVWRAPRVGMRRLLGVLEGRALLSGSHSIVARDLKSGKAVWRRKLSGRVVGHGAVGSNYVAVSTSQGLEVLNGSGRLLFSYRWKKPREEAGNVLVHGENIYTVSATHLNAYCDMAAVNERLAARARAQPNKALPHFLNGALAIAGGKCEEAIGTLKTALKLAGPGERYAGQLLSDAIKGKLWQCYWKLAQTEIGKGGHEAALQHISDSLACAPDSERASRALLQRAKSLRELKRNAEALSTYHRLMSEHPDVPCSRPDGSRLRGWLLAKSEISDLIKAGGAEAYATYEAKAGELLARARESGNAADAEKVVSTYPNSRAANQALLLAARLAAKAGRSDMELRYLRRQTFLQGELAAGTESRKRLAEAYARCGYYTAARRLLAELRNLGETSGQPADEALGELAARPELAGPPRPALLAPMTVAWKVGLTGASVVPGCAGDRQVVVASRDQEGKSLVVAVDVSSGKQLWSFDIARAGLGSLHPYQYAGREQVKVDGDAVLVNIGNKRAVVDRGSGKLRWKTETGVATPHYYHSGYSRGLPTRLYSCSDGVLVSWETVSKVNQLGTGEERKLLRAVSVDDGQELWALLVSKKSGASWPGYHYGSRGQNGLTRAGSGRLVAWKYTPGTYRPKRTEQKTELMVIDPAIGRLISRFTTKKCSALGMIGNRLLCQDKSRKTLAFKLDGKKAWAGSGKWALQAVDEKNMIIVVNSQKRVSGRYQQEMAAVDARGGKLLWKGVHAKGGSSIRHHHYGGYGRGGIRNAVVAGGMLIVAQNARYNPYTSHYNSVRKSQLNARAMKGGKMLWQSPFVPANHTRAAGKDRLVCGFMLVEQLDKEGQVIQQKRNRWGGLQRIQQEVSAVRMTTVVRLFNLDGGKAVWEWRKSKTYKSPAGQMGIWHPRGGGGKVLTTAEGLLITTPEGVVMLRSAQTPKPAPKPSASSSAN